ncbi:MAG TPA: C4-type zinc ribbon domain-containing protein [Bryobacteraceae bacterium]|nr:C4-type zinc ribbon domain-containing protein [Bryobacteraceae bacterium]
MKAQIEAVLQVQRLDVRAAELRKEITALPKRVAEIEKKLETHTKRLEADRVALAANQKKRKGLEDEVKTHEAKISKLNDQTLHAKTNDQYRAFQNEIGWCRDEIRKCEDSILELMGESEALDAAVKEAEKAIALEKQAVEREKNDARQLTTDDQAALTRIAEERKQLEATIDKTVLSKYEHVRKRWGGTGVANATDGRCDACHIGLRPQHFQELKRGDKVMTCESCGRILYYNPPISLEHELHQKV